MLNRITTTLVGYERDRNEIQREQNEILSHIEAKMQTNSEVQTDIEKIMKELTAFSTKQEKANEALKNIVDSGQKSIGKLQDTLITFRSEQKEANTDFRNGIKELERVLDSEQKNVEKLQFFTWVNCCLSMLTLVTLILHDQKTHNSKSIERVARRVGAILQLESDELEKAVDFCIQHSDLKSFALSEEELTQQSPETANETIIKATTKKT